MKRTMSLTALACAMTMGLAAQTPPPAGGAQTARPSSDASGKVTVTGCLEKASSSAASPTGTSGAGAAGAASASAKFVLNNVSAGAPSAGGTAGAAGTSGAARPSASSYKIDGDDAKLTPHVGHKVEITGSVESASSGAGAAAGAGAASAGGSSASGQTLKVDSVKMLAASCTQ